MQKILILGAKGMLGQALVIEFSDNKNYNLIAWDRENLDITDSEKVIKSITDIKPEVIINAAAYTDVDGAETNKELLLKVNTQAVGYLTKASRIVNALFIHISTDYIFDGKNKKGYKETDFSKKSLNTYGESKRLGEEALIREAGDKLKYYLIRTSWLFGLGGKNFVKTMINTAYQRKDLSIVDDQQGKPTYAKDLANTIKYMIESDIESGIYHFTNEPKLTWYKFAKIIFDTKKEIDSSFPVPKVFPISSEEFSRPAKRPKYSVLLNKKLPKGRNIKMALKDYLRNTDC
ncbi:MAG: dTDP-4-dehydrorhamnose reductase [Candidatus Paceibacterota bacterium]